MRASLLIAAGAWAVMTGPATVQSAPVEQPIYSFKGSPDGSNPVAGVVVDGKTGVVYGVTTNGGAQNAGIAFELTPPTAPGGLWTETVLHSFGPAPDGVNPTGLIADQNTGILYGTTLAGGANGLGTLFTLTPPSAVG